MPESRTRLWTMLVVALLGTVNAPRVLAVSLPHTDTGLNVAVDESSGVYSVTSSNPDWKFSGTVGAPVTGVKVTGGKDKLGAYREVSFRWKTDISLQGAIRQYSGRPLARFAVTMLQATSHFTADFPAFTGFPQNLHMLSYKEDAMSPPKFGFTNNGAPWFLFDDNAHTAVLSAGSDFLVSQMHGDGNTLIASGLNPSLSNIPAGFTHTSWLVLGQGIESTVHAWGNVLTDLSGKPRPADNSDLIVKYFGYWTDNGAYYYYNYDPSKGYAGTILAVADYYKSQNIPIHYMQLDSWWYQKTQISPEGKDEGPKNAKLPVGTWNAYGGTLDYTASPDLFPNGLAAFQKQLGLPLVVHGRWIDPTSPYHQNYKISGIAPVDPRWWNDRADYLKGSGVITYEQDWLNEIYGHSPEMASTLDAGPAFTDNMAAAAKRHGQTLQYCMPLPRFFLQGINYNNLTTIRTSGDRFDRRNWNDFLYTSILADSLHIRPWVDVFKSPELGNLTIAVLSSGPVGTGDAIGTESRDNILSAVRADGVIVKPDAPLLPTDATILADAGKLHQPLIASTYTDNGQRTVYAFAYPRKGDALTTSFTPASLGLTGQVYVYNTTNGTGQLLNSDQTYTDTLTAQGYAAYILAPVGKSGIAFLGDAGKIVGTGRQRIPAVLDEVGRLTVNLTLSPTETGVTLQGYAASAPKVVVEGGTALPVSYDPTTSRFTVQIAPAANAPVTEMDSDPVKSVQVVFRV